MDLLPNKVIILIQCTTCGTIANIYVIFLLSVFAFRLGQHGNYAMLHKGLDYFNWTDMSLLIYDGTQW